MKSAQGQRANRSGRTIEDALVAFLGGIAGIVVERQRAIGTGIFGGEVRGDIFISGSMHFPQGLIVESKWQDCGGSADEKLAYLYLNIKHCYPCPCIVVVDGGGHRAGAVTWLKEQVDEKRLYAVHSLGEFFSWAMRNL